MELWSLTLEGEVKVLVIEFAMPRTIACQVPLSMEFSKQEYWRGLPFPPPGHFPDPGIKPTVSFMTSLFHLSLDRYNRKYKKA